MPITKLRRDLKAVAGDVQAIYRGRRRPTKFKHLGVNLELSDDWATRRIRDALYNGYYERSEQKILRSTLRHSDRYLELGAGIGLLATTACQIVSGGRVIAYEANPRLISIIQHTAELNGFSPTVKNEVQTTAGGAEGSSIDFYIRPHFWASSLLPGKHSEVIRVPTVSWATTLATTEATYLAIDIEGGEVDLLSEGLPGHVRAICLEVHPHLTGVDSTRRMLVSLLQDGFALDTNKSARGVLFLERQA